jgi:carbonic anhydrase
MPFLHRNPHGSFLYDVLSSSSVLYNFLTVKLSLEQPCVAQMAGGGLPGSFSLAQIHFHWGSEHTMDGKRWDLCGHNHLQKIKSFQIFNEQIINFLLK